MAGLAKFDLTKQWLEERNIKVEGYSIYHLNRNNIWYELTQRISEAKHEKGINKVCNYSIVGFYCKEDKKIYTLPVHRILYAWYIGPALKGYDVCHIDGNGMNNSIDNLELKTHKENLHDRTGAVNQYGERKHDYELDVEYWKLYYDLELTRNLKNEIKTKQTLELWHKAVKNMREYLKSHDKIVYNIKENK